MSSLHPSASPGFLASSASSPSASSVHLKDTGAVPLWKKVVFSGLSGAIATTCIYPLAITKTKLHMETGSVRSGPWQMVRRIAAEGGAVGFYRGWPPNVLLVMPEKAIKLSANDYFQQRLRRPGQAVLMLPQELAAGGLAGLCQVVATQPMELLQIRGAVMADRVKQGELKGAVSYPALVRQLGLSGLYTGVVATLARDIPFSMCYFSMYSQLKRRMLRDSSEQLMLKSLLAGCIAGTAAAALTCPFDVVKTRVQAAAAPAPGLSPFQFLSRELQLWRQTFSHLLRHEGAPALFRGVLPRCAIISPLFGITMTCYEEFQQLWG